jgi:hypothetical protein
MPNPMVDYLNSLRTQQADSNPSYVYETRQAFLEQLRVHWPWVPTAEELHVPSRLDGLVKSLLEGRTTADIVFLTGDAGDGKTAICARLAAGLGGEAELQPITQHGPWTIVKDASEVPEDDLRALLERHLARDAHGTCLVVAINEGRLRRVLRHPFAARPHLQAEIIEPALDAGLDNAGADRLDAAMKTERIIVLNFRHRFHVRPLLGPLLDSWTRPALWEAGPACAACPARAGCPILANVTDLRNPLPRERLADLLTSVHFSGQRLPFRRLQALLALTVTGGLCCTDVQSGPLSVATAQERLRYRFYEAVFRTNPAGPVVVQPEVLTLALVPLDPGRTASRAFDDEVTGLVLSGAKGAGLPPLAGRVLPEPEHATVRTLGQEVAEGSPNISSPLALLTRSLRRWEVLTAAGSADRPLWHRALALLEGYAAGHNDGRELREHVVGALNRLHRVEGHKGDLLTGRQVDPGGFRTTIRQALEIDLRVEFETRLARGPVLPPEQVAPWLEACCSEIYLEAWPREVADPKPARLQLDTRLVEALLGVTTGYRYFRALGPYRRDLARFFSQLAGLAIEAGHTPRVSLRCNDRRVRVSSVGDKLRFDVEG